MFKLLEPEEGIEPSTSFLPRKRSADELLRHIAITVLLYIMDSLISSLIAFLIALVPTSFVQLTKPPIDQTTIIFTGDIMLGRSVMGEAVDRNDYLYPFRNVQSIL